MTSSSSTAELSASAIRPVDLSLARAHLRLGAFALARVELEILARAGGLDSEGWVDLAEVRWRTGDLGAAGDAATRALAAIDDAPIALVIAAEASAALGRPNEARRLANRAMERVGGSIDAIFAGMPRSAIWPADAAEPSPTAPTLFHQEPIPPPTRRAGDADDVAVSALRAHRPGPATGGGGPAARPPLGPGFWDAASAGEAATPDLPDPVEELEAARHALVAGSLDEASLRFALVLRLAPQLAPAVLEATEGSSGPGLSVVRGDAFRLVGLESEARRAYAMAAWSGSRDRRRSAAEAAGPATEAAAPAASDTIPPVQRTCTQGRHARK